ncbi:hypothetical protein [Rodentibacter caecimuris]|uniref:hypothetical protein n=1 Tax=Rodentibacter caecimuris TaxID=1796644 RepID=UPI0015C33B81
MRKRKTFMKTGQKRLSQITVSRNLRLRRLKRYKYKIFERHALQFVVQDIC